MRKNPIRRNRWRPGRQLWDRVVRTIRSWWHRLVHIPDGPGAPPPLAKAEALRQGALLSEFTDARADRRVA